MVAGLGVPIFRVFTVFAFQDNIPSKKRSVFKGKNWLLQGQILSFKT